MNKEKFLKELRSELYEAEIAAKSIDEIVEDYDALISEAIIAGEAEEDIIGRLGRPSQIARSLSKFEAENNGMRQKMIAISPFVATIVFFILGMQLDLWHPGWMVFFIVPIAGVLFGARLDFKTQLVSLSPFFTAIFYLLYGFIYGVWHPTWVVFFIIVIFGLLFEEDSKKKYLGIVLFTIVPLVYLFLELNYDFQYSWLIFSILVIAGLFNGMIQFKMSTDPVENRKFQLITLGLGVIYVILSITFNIWHPLWLIFLAVPVYAMLKIDEKIPFVAYTPFITTVVFVALGELFNIYEWAWLVFLAIPIAGIFTEGDDDVEYEDGDSVTGFGFTVGEKKTGVEVKFGNKVIYSEDDEESI